MIPEVETDNSLNNADLGETAKKPESLLYQERGAFSPEDLHYRFDLKYQDPDFKDKSLQDFMDGFNSQNVLMTNTVYAAPSTGAMTIISPAHGRSSVLNTDENEIDLGLPEYRAFSLKGNILPTDISVAEVGFDFATGLRIQGAMVGDARMIGKYPEKCRKIAEAGIPSERIVAIFRASHVPFGQPGKPETWDVPREFTTELREEILRQMNANIDSMLAIDAEQQARWGGSTEINAIRRERLISQGDILIFLRAMQVNERIRDVRYVNKESLQRFCAAAKDFVSDQDPEKYQFIPFENTEDDVDFLVNWLPRQMGFHLGSWHAKGFVHGFTHGQNWTLAGSLIDNDSAREKANFDLEDNYQREAYHGYILYDLIRSFEAIIEIFDGLRTNEIIKSYDRNLEKKFMHALLSFLVEYIKTTFSDRSGIEQKVSTFLQIVLEELPNPHFDAMRDDDSHMTISIQKLDWRQTGLWFDTIKALKEKFKMD